jgi:hypothetical protein
VSVYDNTNSNLETHYGPYTITIALTQNTGTMVGTQTGTTVSGVATFSGLRIISSGSFTITASCTDMTSSTTSSISMTNYPYTLQIQTSNTTPSSAFSFVITVNIFGEDQRAFTGSATVLLSETSGATISGASLSQITTSGTATYTIFISSLGTRTIRATCNALTASVGVTIEQSSLIISQLTPVVLHT